MLALQGVATFVPGVRRLLGTAPIGLVDLLVVAGATLGPLVVNELTKPPMPESVRGEAADGSAALEGAESDEGIEASERREAVAT